MAFQISSALLDACVLAILADEPTYGYVLTQRVRELVPLSESTLYPVLRRLLANEQLHTYDQPISGRLRRYYAITDKGRESLAAYQGDWRELSAKIDEILMKGAN
ncbi:MAG: PadR family transcriptional regulator [Clostridia bacterium]|nr:PadR family transcriptional regulator [Clostridia bacterium]